MKPEFTTGQIAAVECAKEGWELVKSDFWLLLAISLVGGFIGGMSMYILIGAMICGIFYAYLRKLDTGVASFDDLWVGFKYFVPSLPLMLAIVVPMVAFFIIMFVTLYLPLITAAMMGNHADGGVILGTFVFGIIIDVVVAIVMISIHSLLIFSFPLIVDRQMSSWPAMKLSARAVLKNIGGVGGLIVVNFGLALVGELMLCVGIYLVIPIITATNVIAYRRVFPKPAAGSFGPPPLSAYPGI
jgi:hypothetical protein